MTDPHRQPHRLQTPAFFPEQAVNWAWYQEKIKAAGRPIRVLNLFGYTGGAALACLAGRPSPMWMPAKAWWPGRVRMLPPVTWLTAPAAGSLTTASSSYSGKSAAQQVRRRHHGPAELWAARAAKLAGGQLYDLITLTEQVLSDDPLFLPSTPTPRV